jgi:two-component system, NtrC family, response regulator AtoC
MTRSVLVVDDEKQLARNIAAYLDLQGYLARDVNNGAEALAVLGSFAPDVILLDLRLPDVDGVELVGRIKLQHPRARIVIMTAYASYPTAVLAIKAGADDYLPKPVVLEELRLFLERLSGTAAPASAPEEAKGLAAIQGSAPEIVALRATIVRLVELERQSGQPAPVVLVIGETGTGKQLVARALHQESLRAAGPFVELNCTTLPDQLIEDELFGHERGAFTDAKEGKKGLIEIAHGGTLFLDEIGDVGPLAQVKLLRFLEDRRVRRLGSVQEHEVEVRIIAATNQPLEQLVRDGRFRADLYFRLRVVELTVPPLRARPTDILPLARSFLGESARRWRRGELHLSPAAERALGTHSWPGNVRELKNVIEQAALMARTDEIGPEHLALSRLAEAPPAAGEAFRLPSEGLVIGDLERDMLQQALDRCGWNVTAASRLLGVSRDVLRYRMQKHGLLRPS